MKLKFHSRGRASTAPREAQERGPRWRGTSMGYLLIWYKYIIMPQLRICMDADLHPRKDASLKRPIPYCISAPTHGPLRRLTCYMIPITRPALRCQLHLPLRPNILYSSCKFAERLSFSRSGLIRLVLGDADDSTGTNKDSAG